MLHYSQKKDLFPMQGGCPCGHTRYEMSLPPILVHCCHCTLCQRQLGTAFAINAILESSAVTLLPSAPPAVADHPADPRPVPCGVLPGFARLTDASTAAETPPVLDRVCLPTPSAIGQTVAQCPVCHSVLWSHYPDAGRHCIYLRVGTLDCSWEIEPDVHIFTRSKHRFVQIPDDGTPVFEQYYPDRSAFYRHDVLPRVKALEKEAAPFKSALRKELGMPENA